MILDSVHHKSGELECEINSQNKSKGDTKTMTPAEKLELLKCMQLIMQNIPEASEYWRNCVGNITYASEPKLIYIVNHKKVFDDCVNQWSRLIRYFY